MSTSKAIIDFLKQFPDKLYSARDISEMNGLRLNTVHSTLFRLKKTGQIAVTGDKKEYKFSYGHQPDMETSMNTQKISIKMNLAEKLEQKGFYRRAASVWGEAMILVVNNENLRKIIAKRQLSAVQRIGYKKIKTSGL